LRAEKVRSDAARVSAREELARGQASKNIYLSEFDPVKNGNLHDQAFVKQVSVLNSL